MTASRREFLALSSMSVVAAALEAQTPQNQMPDQTQNQATPGAPTAWGTSPEVGPSVSPATFAEAEKLIQVQMTAP